VTISHRRVILRVHSAAQKFTVIKQIIIIIGCDIIIIIKLRDKPFGKELLWFPMEYYTVCQM